jgi:hypothetical protein
MPSHTIFRDIRVRGLLLLALAGFALGPTGASAENQTMLIDDFSKPGLTSALGTPWQGFSDQVMGGVSEVSVTRETIDGKPVLRLRGDVRLDNNGGFVQAALDLDPDGAPRDLSAYTGIRLTVRGNDEPYGLHLRTPDNLRPWQSYRTEFTATPDWRTVDLPFDAFVPYRLETPLDTTRLRRIGLVAIGRAFSADLMVSEISLYK